MEELSEHWPDSGGDISLGLLAICQNVHGYMIVANPVGSWVLIIKFIRCIAYKWPLAF